MDLRVLILAVPSAAILCALVIHSLNALPRARAMAFWCAVGLYGVLRGLALRWVTGQGLEGRFPYVIHRPLLPVLGTSLQEIAGWAIVCYLGWWLGHRLASAGVRDGAPRLVPQIVWGCLFLGAISWAVESAAVAAGWWHWTVPVTSRLLVNVPFIGLVDWFFVGVDFLLPFALLTAPGLRSKPARFLSLLAFPLHFGAHCFVDRIGATVPIPALHLAHWIGLAMLIVLAGRSTAVDPAFSGPSDRRLRWIPMAALGTILIDVAAVDLLVARRVELLPAILPAIAVALRATRPVWGLAAGAAGLILGLWMAPLLLAAVPAPAAWILERLRRRARWELPAALLILAIVAWQVHAVGAAAEGELARRLEKSVTARDRGDLAGAEAELRAACRDFPDSHVPRVLLGEIYYRTDRLGEARPLFLEAARIEPSHVPAWRYLSVIDLRGGERESAARFARQGLEIEPEDPQLLYLRMVATRSVMDDLLERFTALGPGAGRALASLAYEVGDKEGAVAMLEEGMARWPEDRWFYGTRIRLALAMRDEVGARRAAAAWRERLPQDAEARETARSLGIE